MTARIEIAKPFFDSAEEQLVLDVLRSGWVTQGPKVEEFEEMFASYVGARFAVAMTSCTTALFAALRLSGIGPGCEVIIPSLSFIATANAVVHCGAIPVFADVDPETCNIDVRAIEGLITEKTKAVMPVHQMGLPADLDTISDLAKAYDLVVIEDAACAIGSKYKEKNIGGHGNIACFSFHPRKIITTGEGGMVVTDDPDTAMALRRFRHHGMSISDLERHQSSRMIIETYPEVGYNFRMTDIQAAIGIRQMEKLPFILKRRADIAAVYNAALSKIPSLSVPAIPDSVHHNYQSYWIKLNSNAVVTRDALMQQLLERNISTKRGIMAIHMEACYRHFHTLLPVTEHLSANTILLPIYPAMTESDLNSVIRALSDILC